MNWAQSASLHTIALWFVADERISSTAATSQLNRINQSAQLHLNSPARTTSQLQYINTPAANSQLVRSAAAFVYVGRSVSAELQCVSSSAICSQIASWQGSFGLNCQPASENIKQHFLVTTWQLTQLG